MSGPTRITEDPEYLTEQEFSDKFRFGSVKTFRGRLRILEAANPGVEYYLRLGRSKIFNKDHQARFEEALRCSSSCGGREGEICTSVAPSEARLYMKAQKLLTNAEPTKFESSGKRNSSTVVSMERGRRQRSSRLP